MQSQKFCRCAAILYADHIESTKAVLAGLKNRFEVTGKAPTLIHTVSLTFGLHTLTSHICGES